MDDLSGRTWDALLNLDVPDQPYLDFIRPQRAYLRETFGPDVSTTHELHLKEMARLVTGPWGTMMNRSIWDDRFQEQAEISIRFTDDVRFEDPPEYRPGQIGMAYNYSTVRSLKPGRYVTELDWFFPLSLSPDPTGEGVPPEVRAYLDMYDHPLWISAGGPWFLNQPRPKAVGTASRGADGRKASDEGKEAP